MLDTIEGHRRIRQNLGALVDLADQMDTRMSPTERLGLYEAITSHAEYLGQTAAQLAGLWNEPDSDGSGGTGVVYG